MAPVTEITCNGSDMPLMMMSPSRQVTSGDGNHRNQTLPSHALTFYETNAELVDPLGIDRL
jgi:hypothetical protein